MNIFTMARVRRALLMLGVAVLAGAWWGDPAAAQTEPTPTLEITPAAGEATPTLEVTPAASETPPIVDGAAAESPTPTPSPTPGRPIDIRFGIIESFEDPGAAGRLGVAWTRARFQWADVQPTSPDDWEPPLDDEALDAELAAGREVVGLLIGVPAWARDRRGLPRGLALPPDDPDNTWAVFVGDVVSRYAGRIDRWIIWNEPDIDDRDAPGHTWDGTAAEFFQLQRAAYLAARAANSEAVIHLAAFTYFWDPGYFARFLDLAAADPDAAANNYYFDVATAHLYFQPNGVYNVLYAFRQIMDSRGLNHPLWLVETNAPPMNDPYWEVDNWTLAVDLFEQAAFIPQSIATALAAGAERVAVYKLKDTAGDRAANPEPFGLIRWDNSRRPAFDTYRVAIRLMAGTTAATRERWDAVGQVRLSQAGQSTTVLFARLPDSQTARVPATAGEAELVDMWGERETITAADGVFTIELPGALCLQTIANYCMIGGTTYYLIQVDDEMTPVIRPPTTDRRPPQEGGATDEASATAISPTDAPRATGTARPSPTGEPSPTQEPTVTPTSMPTQISPATRPPSTATPVAAAVAEAPEATPDVQPAAGGTALASYSGLVALGLGLVLGLGLIGWGLAGRRARG